MPKVIIYTSNNCPYCVKAKILLDKKHILFEEINIANDEMREKMIIQSGGKKTVPQIFINDQHIGGCNDLYELEQQNKLDDLLQANIINL